LKLIEFSLRLSLLQRGLFTVLGTLVSMFKPAAQLRLESLAWRQPLAVLRRWSSLPLPDSLSIPSAARLFSLPAEVFPLGALLTGCHAAPKAETHRALFATQSLQFMQLSLQLKGRPRYQNRRLRAGARSLLLSCSSDSRDPSSRARQEKEQDFQKLNFLGEGG
jgi:hypothetical protein